MRIDQLIVLLALVVLANLVLLAALVMPRLAARRTGGALVADGGPSGEFGGGPVGNGGPRLSPAMDGGLRGALSDSTYERVVRVVSYLFIGSALLVVTVTGAAEQPLTYVLLALGAFLIVLGQDIVPLSLLGRWRYPVEALSVTVFVTLLVLLTGGYQSPFFFGYLLLLAGAALWAGGVIPFVLALLASGAYLLAVALAPSADSISPEAMGIIAFNLVALALISYVAAVIGREQRRAREAALDLSRVDYALTGLYTRGHFNTALDREVLLGERSNRSFSVVMIDLDGLKTANDEYGHATGDRLLRASAGAIREGLRASDLAARYGGDEFAVLLPETDQTGALLVAEKLRQNLFSPLQGEGERIQSSASVGLVTFPNDGRTSRELMRRADLAMYEAKRRGGNRIIYYPQGHEPPSSSGPQTAGQPPSPPPGWDSGAPGRPGAGTPAPQPPDQGGPSRAQLRRQPSPGHSPSPAPSPWEQWPE